MSSFVESNNNSGTCSSKAPLISKELVHQAAMLSLYIYDIGKYDVPEGFQQVFRNVESPKNGRTANWAIFKCAKQNIGFIVFRGSVTVMDWIVNGSFVAVKHQSYPNIKVHAGYSAEIINEFEFIVDALNECFPIPPLQLIVSGHSKGGGLAQLFADQLVAKSLYVDTVCAVTFAAPIIFWFQRPDDESNIMSRNILHNYIIKGDPVPVAQLLLTDNRSSIERLGGITYLMTGMSRVLDEIVDGIVGYRPVGNIYVASIADFADLRFIEFKRICTNYSSWKEWDCVNTNNHSARHHEMTFYCDLLDTKKMIAEYEEDKRKHEKALARKAKNYWSGLFVQNDTDEDILFIMSQVSPLHWSRVPKGQLRYVGSGRVWFNVSATIYKSTNVPTQSGVATKLSAVSGVAVASTALALTGIGLLYEPILYAAATTAICADPSVAIAWTPTDPRLHFKSGVYANGRTVVVSYHGTTKFLEIQLI